MGVGVKRDKMRVQKEVWRADEGEEQSFAAAAGKS
jgi:hypothetical protein